MLELNARPGLAFQIANRWNLWNRLRVVGAQGLPDTPVEEGSAFPTGAVLA